MKLRIIVCSLLAALAFAQAPAPDTAAVPKLKAAKGLKAFRGRVAKALGLSAEQKAQIRTIRQQSKTSAQPVVAQLKQNRASLNAAIKAGDTAQIQSLSKSQGELMGQVLTIRTEAKAQVYAGLSPDQRTKFDAIQARVQSRLAQRQAKRALAN